MRRYQDKTNNQKHSLSGNRFFKSGHIPREEVTCPTSLKLLEKLDSLKKDAYTERGCFVVWIDKKDIKNVAKKLKSNGYDMMVEMSAMDYLADRNKFEMFYEFLNTNEAKRARIRFELDENDTVDSITDVFKSANWSERETYDMFGIIFKNHPYFRRILMPEDWTGYPLRKTYPLHGDEDASWYEVDKIFGKEYRDIVGAERRKPSEIERKNTKEFARLGYEVAWNEEYKDTETPIIYQEEGGVPLVKTLDKSKSKTINDRER